MSDKPKKNYSNEHPKYNVTYKSVTEGGPIGLKEHDTFYDKFGKYVTPYWYMEKLLEKKKKKSKKKKK